MMAVLAVAVAAVIAAVASIVVGGWRGRNYVGDCGGNIVHVVGDGSREVAGAGDCTQGEDSGEQRVFDQVLPRLIA